MSLADKQAVLAAARQFLSSFDYASIDRKEAIANWRAAEAKAIAAEAPEERQPKLTGDELELQAVSAEVNRQLDAYLAARGLRKLDHRMASDPDHAERTGGGQNVAFRHRTQRRT